MTTNVSVEGAILEAVGRARNTISLQEFGDMIDALKGETGRVWGEIRAAWAKNAEDIGFTLSNPTLYASIKSRANA